MPRPGTLDRPISPPPLRRNSSVVQRKTGRYDEKQAGLPSSAAIEAGEVEIRDHLKYFVNHLSTACRPSSSPRISIHDFSDLYHRNQHAHGRHFVVHQHDHPVSGVHYDLRLQFSETSSISFAIPYGMPGNPNSARPNRMAIETRVHNLWNHLIESASHATGSLLIWDIGEYELLPRKREVVQQETDSETSDLEAAANASMSESARLFQAFQSRYIRLRLHGTKLPQGYTVALRLPSANNRSTQPNMAKRKRRRVDRAQVSRRSSGDTDIDSDESTQTEMQDMEDETADRLEDDGAAGLASDEEEDTTIRSNNAYTGATNTIGSIHQRHWFLTLDRHNSGFRRASSGSDAGRWVGDWEPFFVRGRDHERSVVTGRCADDIMIDERVEQFVGRKMWRPIVE